MCCTNSIISWITESGLKATRGTPRRNTVPSSRIVQLIARDSNRRPTNALKLASCPASPCLTPKALKTPAKSRSWKHRSIIRQVLMSQLLAHAVFDLGQDGLVDGRDLLDGQQGLLEGADFHEVDEVGEVLEVLGEPEVGRDGGVQGVELRVAPLGEEGHQAQRHDLDL